MKTDYWHALDKRSAQNLDVNPQQIGISHGIGDVAKGLQANVFAGASTIELGFMGVQKGSRSTPMGVTPELYGKSEREDMRNMAKINEITVSTHATANIQGFAGLDPQKGGFKPEKREEALHEIERAIDFAADVAQGGPIVVHTGEFPRPIYEADKSFEQYREEEKTAPIYFVDKRTGDLKGIDRDKEIPFALKEKGEYKRDEKGELQIKMRSYSDIEENFNKLPEEDKKKFDYHPEKYFYNEMKGEEVSRYTAEAEHFDNNARQLNKKLEKYYKVVKPFRDQYEGKGKDEEFYKDFVAANPAFEEEEKRAIKQIGSQKFFDEQVEDLRRMKKYYEEGAVGYKKAAKSAEVEIDSIEPIRDYAVKRSAETLARAAITAYDRERAQKLDKPLFIAPENIFPESYGSHPQELKTLIKESRHEMARKLKDERGISQSKADQIAADHIKATFDIGHANTWKKFFKGKPEDFNKWMKEQVADLQKEKIIGHVHLSDNFGYYDEHVTPGEGTAPIKEFVEKLQKDKFKGAMIVEPGGQPEGQIFSALKGAWRALSSPAYRLDTAGMAWTDVDQSYFGRTGSPTYVVGDYAPSKDWTLWSETPLE